MERERKEEEERVKEGKKKKRIKEMQTDRQIDKQTKKH